MRDLSHVLVLHDACGVEDVVVHDFPPAPVVAWGATQTSQSFPHPAAGLKNKLRRFIIEQKTSSRNKNKCPKWTLGKFTFLGSLIEARDKDDNEEAKEDFRVEDNYNYQTIKCLTFSESQAQAKLNDDVDKDEDEDVEVEEDKDENEEDNKDEADEINPI